MRINTKTDTLELTKPEQAIVGKAYDIIVKVAKHGSGQVQTSAEDARESVQELLTELSRAEDAKAQTKTTAPAT